MLFETFQNTLTWQLDQRKLDGGLSQSSARSKLALWRLAQKEFGSSYEYSRAYKGHFGCVYALAYSSGEGRLLATGGDDCRVLVRLPCFWGCTVTDLGN